MISDHIACIHNITMLYIDRCVSSDSSITKIRPSLKYARYITLALQGLEGGTERYNPPYIILLSARGGIFPKKNSWLPKSKIW